MIDLDHFKNINDTFGHEAGDLTLKEVSKIFLFQVRKDDIACRLGGDEFILIFYDTCFQAVFDRCEKIRVAISEMKSNLDGKLIGPITASFGIAMYPEHATEADKLMRSADQALYQSKKLDRNRITSA